jgi:hypothetical protein
LPVRRAGFEPRESGTHEQRIARIQADVLTLFGCFEVVDRNELIRLEPVDTACSATSSNTPREIPSRCAWTKAPGDGVARIRLTGCTAVVSRSSHEKCANASMCVTVMPCEAMPNQSPEPAPPLGG